MAQHFKGDGLKLVIAAVGIEQIVRHHGIEVGAREGQADAMKHQQGRLQIMDHLGPRGVVQQGCDGPHVGANVEWNECGVVPCRQRDPLHVRLRARPRGKEALQAKAPAFRQSLDKSLCRGFIMKDFYLHRVRIGLSRCRLKGFEERG